VSGSGADEPYRRALNEHAIVAVTDAAGRFRTGDLGCLLDGELFVFGRLKEIIIVNGRNLFAGDLEAALGDLPGLKRGRAVAFGIDSATTGSEELVLVAEAEDDASDPAAIAAQISRAIAERFLVQPRDVRVVRAPWLVKSSSGKISRDANRARYLEQFRGDPP
jgi:acyl-CoA synthetase (AMP-forming)/AMP-acid ligase II